MSNRELDVRLARALGQDCCPWKGCDCAEHPEQSDVPAYSDDVRLVLRALTRRGYHVTIEVMRIASGDAPDVTAFLYAPDGQITYEAGTLDDLAETVARLAVRALEGSHV